MGITIIRRQEWEQKPYLFSSLSTPLFPSWGNIQWLVCHWPGGNVRPDDDEGMRALIRSQQVGYRNKKPTPFNLGYNWLLDPWGKFWESRGFTYRNAANDGDKLKATMGNINYITMSVQVVCNLNEGANAAQTQAMRDMQETVHSLSGRWMPWRPHWYSDSTVCPGPVNTAFIEADAFNYIAPIPQPNPPTGTNPLYYNREEQTVMMDFNGMILEYDGFRIRRVVSGNAVIGTPIAVKDVNVFDIINEPDVRVGTQNPFEGAPGLEKWKNDFLAAAWRTKQQQGLVI